MFYNDGILCRSNLLDITGICHGFSTKHGGISSHQYTKEMNLAFGREDDDDTVRRNLDIFAQAVSGGELDVNSIVAAPQIHSDRVRRVGKFQRGEGAVRSSSESCDGFVTDVPGVMLLVRVADCTPVIMTGEGKKGTVVAAIHAGWRGTAAGIVVSGINEMRKLGVEPAAVKAAIGAHIGVCCFEVGEDMKTSVSAMRGADFASRHIKERTGNLYADLTSMNRELLLECGVLSENIDASEECTCCLYEKYHSHRKTSGRRGAMGASVAILPTVA